MSLPVVTTDRLVLDAPNLADAPAWSAAQDDECARWFDWPCPPGLKRCTASLEGLQHPSPDDYVWAIRRDGTFVGSIDLRLLDDGAWNVSYFVAPETRGQHVARQALAAVVAWGFDGLGLPEITTSAHTDNVASRTVPGSAGFALAEVGRDDEDEHDVASYG